VIQSLAFTPLGRHSNDACARMGYDPARCSRYTRPCISASPHGVRLDPVRAPQLRGLAYNSIASAGAEIVRHSTPAEGLVQLKEALLATTGKALAQLLLGGAGLDRAHARPGQQLSRCRDRQLLAHVRCDLPGRREPGHALSVHCDHGHVYADARQTLYLNERFPQLAGCLPVSHTGNPIYPNGSPRDVFLHVRTERREEVLRLLRGNSLTWRWSCDGRGVVGGAVRPQPIAPELRRRLGDILILPYLGNFIWWRVPGLNAERFLRPPRRPVARGN